VRTVHAVGEDSGRRSDNDRTDDFGLDTGGSWWCGEEVMENSNFVVSKEVLYQCVRGRNLARRVYSHDRAVIR
jgi:hypothetical protein